jgi:hypothetical protein
MPIINSTLIKLNQSISVLKVTPNEPLILTGELNLWSICVMMSHDTYMPCPSALFLQTGRLKGVEVINGWENTNGEVFHLTVFQSIIRFYLNDQPPGQYECESQERFTKEYGHNFTHNAFTFFNVYGFIELESSVTFDKDIAICPFLFTNARLNQLAIWGLVDSFVVTNLFKFQQTVNSSSSINSNVSNINLNGYNLNYDSSMLDPLVFEQVQSISFSGTIGSIDLNFTFKSLKNIKIQVFSLKNFFHRVGTEWTRRLNDFSKNIQWFGFGEESVSSAQMLYPGRYTYPNEDLCIFEPVPVQPETTAVPVLNTNYLSVCTDPMAWLTQNYKFHNWSFFYSASEYPENIDVVYAQLHVGIIQAFLNRI